VPRTPPVPDGLVTAIVTVGDGDRTGNAEAYKRAGRDTPPRPSPALRNYPSSTSEASLPTERDAEMLRLCCEAADTPPPHAVAAPGAAGEGRTALVARSGSCPVREAGLPGRQAAVEGHDGRLTGEERLAGPERSATSWR